MSSVLPEAAYDTWVDIPAASSSMYADGKPLDSGTWMLLASNLTRLLTESVRHLVLDASARFLDRTGKADTWGGITSASGPSAADVAALPAAEKYRGVSWMGPYTQRYGPVVMIADRAAADGSAVCRAVKILAHFSNLNGNAARAHFALTTHPDPRLIPDGNVSAYGSVDITHAGTIDALVTLSADAHDGITLSLPARRGSTSAGPYLVKFVPLFLWMCVDSTAGTTCTALSSWEVRT